MCCSSILPLLQPRPESRLRVAGNLPFYITSPILLKLAGSHAALESAVLMVQREVADRVTAVPGTREYGLLSVTAQMYGPVERLFTLPPSAFLPATTGAFNGLSLAVCAAICRTRRSRDRFPALPAAGLCAKTQNARQQPACRWGVIRSRGNSISSGGNRQESARRGRSD